MHSSRVLPWCVLSVLCLTAPAFAQSTYVGGSLVGEIARFGGVDIDDDNDARIASSLVDSRRDGESIGFDLRVGRALGERWGVELALVRGGGIENRQDRRLSSVLPPTGIIIPPGFPLPVDFGFELVSEQHYTTIDTVGWLRQDIGGRAHLNFLGGVSFIRSESEQSVSITDSRLAIYLPYPPQLEVTQYGVGPVVGAETIIDLGEHAAITAGARIHGGVGGWLIRPAVGARWSF